MKITYKKIAIQRGPMSRTLTEVPPWELPILFAIHGDGNITLEGDGAVVERELDPRAEHERLGRKFGVNPEGGRPWVVEVYGPAYGPQLAEEIRKHVSTGRRDGGMRKHEIMARLDELEVGYNPRASRAELMELLDAATGQEVA